MRIFLLPITTRQALIYCQTSARQSAAPPSIADRIINKATQTWAKWEEADRGWQKTLVKYGNAGLQRIPFQEWGLKSFPPAKAKLEAEYMAKNTKFDVFFPGNVMRQEDVPKTLLRLARERKTLHWNRFIGSMIAMPLTIPFALVPVYDLAGSQFIAWVAYCSQNTQHSIFLCCIQVLVALERYSS